VSFPLRRVTFTHPAPPQVEEHARILGCPVEFAAAEAKRNERKVAAKEVFRQWLTKTTDQSLDADLPSEGLLVHVPLNEGTGNAAKNLTGTPATFPATGEVLWTPDGKIGPAPTIKPGATFDLGANGDFQKDQPFSCGAWIKAGSAGQPSSIIARMDEQDSFRGWDLWLSNNALAVHVIESWPESTIKVATRKDVVKPGEWQHVFRGADACRGGHRAEAAALVDRRRGIFDPVRMSDDLPRFQ
jgi:hypothetical protein